MELFNRWNVDFGGNLAVPADTNFIFKYLFFWILPMPIFQSGLGAIIIGISTFSTAFLIICLLKRGIFINNYKLKFLFSLIMIYSISFSITMSNTGLTSRYRFTTIVPLIYIFCYFADYQKKIFKNSTISK